VVTLSVGAALEDVPVRKVPIAPEPLVPVISTPTNPVITYVPEAVAPEKDAVMLEIETGVDAKVRQSSQDPASVLARPTLTQVKPPPAMLLTVVDPTWRFIKAKMSSFGKLVLKRAVLSEVGVPEVHPPVTDSSWAIELKAGRWASRKIVQAAEVADWLIVAALVLTPPMAPVLATS
jgi:hypothetical protein